MKSLYLIATSLLLIISCNTINAQIFNYANQTSTPTTAGAIVIGKASTFYSGNYSCGYFNGTNIKFGNCNTCPVLNSQGTNYNPDAFFVKHDLNGNTIWQASAGGNGTEEATFCASSQHGMFVAGSFNGSNITFNGLSSNITLSNTSSGTKDVFVGRLRPLDGKFYWAVKPSSTSSDDQIRGFAVKNNFVCIEGEDNFTSPYIKRLNHLTGATLWTIAGPGSGIDFGRITVDATGNLFTFVNAAPSATITQGNGLIYTFPNTGYWQYLVKFNQNGVVISTQQLCHSASMYIYDMALDAVGNIYVAGHDPYQLGQTSGINFGPCNTTYARVPNAGTAIPLYLAKFNSSLAAQWAKSLFVNQDYGDTPIFADMETDSQGNTYILGRFYSNGTGSQPTIGCTTFALNTYTNFVVKCNNSGNVIWSKTDNQQPISGNYNSAGGISIDYNDYCYINGGYFGTDNFDSYTVTNNAYTDFYFAKLNSLANTGSGYYCSNGAPSVIIGTPLQTGATYSWTSTPAGFTSTAAQPTVTQSRLYTVTVTKGACVETDVTDVCICPPSCPGQRIAGAYYENEAQENIFTMFPNPAGNDLFIKLVFGNNYDINLYSINGDLIFSQEIKSNEYLLDLSAFKNGLYFITIKSVDTGSYQSKKLIISH